MTEQRQSETADAEVVEDAMAAQGSAASNAAPGEESPTAARRRPRALRIPDDEVARPQPTPPPPPEPPRSLVPAASPPPPPQAPSASASPPPPPPPARSSLPPLPPLSSDAPVVKPMRIITISPAPPAVEAQVAIPAPATLPTMPTLPTLPADDSSVDVEVESRRSVPPAAGGDEVEVRFDDDIPPAPATPPVDLAPAADGERRSDPGDAPEVAAEDVVTLEPPRAAPVPPARPPQASQPAISPPSKAVPPPPPMRPPLVIVPPRIGAMPSTPPPDAAGARRKARLWWEELFNDDYLRAMERVSDEQIGREAHFIEESLGVERGGALLDLACGTGRHAVELARRGYEVVGFDLSLAMLARAGEDAQERDAKLNFVQGDMREMTFDEQFDGVFCWNTSFGYFEEEKNAQAIARVHRALKGGGLFLLDVVNRDFLVRQSPSLAWFEGDGCVCMDEMSVDFITSRLKIKRTMMLDDGRSREIEYSMRVYSLHELGRVLHDQGFRVREVSGRIETPGVFFGNDSPRSIILAEKR